MRSLSGHISATDSQIISQSVRLRFKDYLKFKTPEALIIYEQRLLPEPELLKFCQEEYGSVLEKPHVFYLARDVVDFFSNTHFYPFRLDESKEQLHIATIPEFMNEPLMQYKHYNYVKHIVPIYYYVENFIRLYSLPDFLAPLPAKDYFDFIIAEAVDRDASDITIAQHLSWCEVYYNVRKKKVRSMRSVPREVVDDVVQYISSCSRASFDLQDASPKYMSMALDLHHRGRIVINSTFYGRAVTIRVLSNDSFATSLEDLNLSEKTIKFIREKYLAPETGLRLVIGSTSSGKNTTTLSALNELVITDKYKIVSVERPVELLVDGIEQINTESIDEYRDNCDSLLRQNPDIAYLSEITTATAQPILDVANTSCRVFTTLHANSIAATISRLQDLTHLNSDRLVMNLQSCIYQELVRDDEKDRVYPVTRCLYFSEDLKEKLFGKSIGEVYKIIHDEEMKWC